MSRFWGGGSSESESEDESEKSSRSGSEEEEEEENEPRQTDKKEDLFDRYLSDEEEDDTPRVVRSQKDKRFEFVNNEIRAIKNAVKINDWTAVLNDFESLLKGISKFSNAFEKEGVPRNFIKMFADLEDALESAWANKDARKKMNVINLKALGSVKQKLRKQKPLYEKDLEVFRANPWETEEDEPMKKQPSQNDEESFDEDEWSEDEEGFKTANKKTRKVSKKVESEDSKAPTKENVEELLLEAIAARGKKNTDRKKTILLLRKLAELAETKVLLVRVMVALIAAQFDQNLSVVQYMPTEAWKSTQSDFLTLLNILDENPNIIVQENGVDELSDDETITDVELADDVSVDEDGNPKTKFVTTKPNIASQGKKRDKTTTQSKSSDNPNLQYVTGSLVSIVERLDDEFTKSLQQTDPHTMDYIERLRDETLMYEMIVRAQRYYERIDRVDPLCRTIQRRIEHIYYKKCSINDKIEKEVSMKLGLAFVESTEMMHQLCTFLYKNSNERVRTRALLCHVYHHALHDRFYQGRDMLLMSHLQETIQHADITTQILYNRTMVQLGICAFRHGLIKETQSALQEMFMSNKIKELLAQGMQSQKHAEKNPEQEKLEKQRQVPFHMHVNIDLLDCIYHTSAMCLEIPSMANNSYDARKRVISKPFRKMLDIIDKQVFTGPPENVREHIAQASKALMTGDWERCLQLILSIKVWDLMPDKQRIFELLSKRIQEEGLRTYLFTYAQYYDTLSLSHLASMFKLTESAVHSIISKMIMAEELQASLDQVAGVVILHRVELSRLQYLALQYAEKVGSLVESNERTFDVRSGGFGKEERREPTQKRARAMIGDRRPGERIGTTGRRDRYDRDRMDAGFSGYRADGEDRQRYERRDNFSRQNRTGSTTQDRYRFDRQQGYNRY